MTKPNLRKVMTALPALGAGALIGQILYAAHRPDLPSFDNNYPSGAFGDPWRPGLHVVALGDSSITAPGVDHVDDAWVRRIAHGLTDRYFVHLQSVAIGGAKVHEVVRDQLPAAIAARPDLAIVSVGGNDAIRGVKRRAFEQHLDHIVSSLVAVGTRVVVVGVGDLGSVPRLPRTIQWYLSARARQFDEISQVVAERYPNTHKVDVWGDLSRYFWEDPHMFSQDRFHASSYGHAQFAVPIMEAVERAVAD